MLKEPLRRHKVCDVRDWHGYWNGAAQLREADPLKQVGKTVGGVPVLRQWPDHG